MTFSNTVLNLSLKLISPSAAPIIHEHAHPQNSLTVTPFSIINGKYIYKMENISALIENTEEEILPPKIDKRKKHIDYANYKEYVKATKYNTSNK